MGSYSRTDVSRRRKPLISPVFIQIGMEVRYRPKLTRRTPEINADSSRDSHLNCLTPANLGSAWENGYFAPIPNAGFCRRLSARQQDGEGACASSPLKFLHSFTKCLLQALRSRRIAPFDEAVKTRPSALRNQAADSFFSWADRRLTFREPVFL